MVVTVTRRVALVGTRGVPARYGGFETCVEEVGSRLAAFGYDVVVYCRTGDVPAPQPTYRGMRLVHLPAPRRRTLETLVHTGLSALHLLSHRVDAVVLFNAANAPWLPVLRFARVPVATHVDGLEWRRSKWGGAGRHYYRWAEQMAVRWSDALIADAKGISDYYLEEFGVPTELLTYGAPLVAPGTAGLADLGLETGGYHLVVARFEPENHVHTAVAGYVASGAIRPLVVVGSAPYSDAYTAQVHDLADERVRFLGGVWDQDLLDQLYANALTYVHGHSVGGTNPSLLRAMGAGAPVIALDVRFNREVVGEGGRWFTDAAALAREIEGAESDPLVERARGAALRARAGDYDWDEVARGYADLTEALATRRLRRRRRRGLGRRNHAPQWAGSGGGGAADQISRAGAPHPYRPEPPEGSGG